MTKEYKLETTRQVCILLLRSGGIAMVSVAVLLFIGRNISLTTSDIVHTRNEFAAFTKKQGSLSELRGTYQSLKGAVSRLEGAIPSMDNVTVVDDYLKSVAAKTANTVILRFDATPTVTEGKSLDLIGLSIQLEGNIQSLLAFLREVENAPYLISIRNISFSLANNFNGSLQATMSAVVYLKAKE